MVYLASNKSKLMNIPLRIAITLVAVCLAIGTFSLHVAAQEQVPSLTIESIDVETLPDIRVLVRGKNLQSGLQEATLSVLEDGVKYDFLARNVVDNGMQIALVIDPGLDLTSVGNSGDAVQFEIANGASSLIQSGILSVRTDLLNAFAVASETASFGPLLGEWQRDHQAVVNRLYQYVPSSTAQPMTLLQSLEGVIDNMEDATLSTDAPQRTIILFSDGLSLLNTTDADQIIGSLQAKGIVFRVVLLGDVNTESRNSLINIAEMSNGNTVTYESASSLNDIWGLMDEESQLAEIVYRLGKAEPNQVSVVTTLADGNEIIATENFPEFVLDPVEIEVSYVGQPDVVERSSDNPESNIEELQPDTLPITVEYAWPDGVEREISSVSYSIDSVEFVQDVGPFDSYELPIVALDEGLHSLQVIATDEYGISSRVESTSINVIVNRPPSAMESDSEAQSTVASNAGSVVSTETTQSDLVQEDASNQGMNILGLQLPETIDIFGVTFLVNGITLLIALFPVIFLLALLLYWLTQRNEQQVEPDYGYYEYDNNGYFYRFEPSADDNMQMTQPQVSVIEPEEELTMPVKLPAFYTNAAAYLVYVSGGEHLPKKIAIETNEPIRIGRKKSFCDQILDDQRVSRLHAVITYEGGNFYVKDEGSSGGTFVNRRKLGPTDKQLLKNNDIINFNEVEYRMEVTEPDSTVESGDEPNVVEESSTPESVVS